MDSEDWVDAILLFLFLAFLAIPILILIFGGP